MLGLTRAPPHDGETHALLPGLPGTGDFTAQKLRVEQNMTVKTNTQKPKMIPDGILLYL